VVSGRGFGSGHKRRVGAEGKNNGCEEAFPRGHEAQIVVFVRVRGSSVAETAECALVGFLFQIENACIVRFSLEFSMGAHVEPAFQFLNVEF